MSKPMRFQQVANELGPSATEEQINAVLVKSLYNALQQAEQKVRALEAIVKATIIETPSGQPCYRTANEVAQGMPLRVERVVRKQLAALAGRKLI